jgi:hypothetical protein
VTTDSTPDLTVPFRDVDKDDGYTEQSVRREVEVQTLAGASVGASPYVATGSPTDVFTLPALTVENTYRTRGRHDDNANVRSDWADFLFVKYSAAPLLSTVTPANAATITDPSPTLQGTFDSPGGKSMAAYRITALAGSTVLYDTDWVASVQPDLYVLTQRIEPFTLPNATVITWSMSVMDSDGLVTTVTRTFTTSFTQPPALASLTLTVDDDNKALFAVWAPSTLATNEFEYYEVLAREEGGQFRPVARIYDKAVTGYRYLGAAHNRETIIRVLQSNGWMDSVPVEASASLPAEGYWIRSASELDELQYVTGHGGDNPMDIETMTPLGRGEKLLLTWGSTGYEGKITLKAGDRALLDKLRSYKTNSEIVMLKFPYGPVRYARITDTPESDDVGQWADMTVGYVELLPSSANF